METTENTELTPPLEPTPQLVLTEQAKYYLHTAGRWATFLGILGFIGTGFVVLIAFFIGTIFTFLGRFNPAAAAIPQGIGGFFTFIYLLVAVFYFFLSYYIYQFGTTIKASTTFNDAALATKAFQNLKSHFKLIGITAIVAIGLDILFIIIGIIAVIGAASTMHQ